MSKVIKAIIVAAMLFCGSHESMANETADNNLTALEEIRSQTALTEAQIVLFEKKQKLEDLRSGKSSIPNTTDFQPMPIPNSYANLAQAPGVVPVFDGQKSVKEITEMQDEVLGVVGVDGKYTATVRSGSGIYTVSQGDKISGGVVAIISLDKVVVKKAGKSVSLPFADLKS